VIIVKSLLFSGVAVFFCMVTVHGQGTPEENAAAKPVQPSERSSAVTSPAQTERQIKIPAGTPVEIEAAYTVRSDNVRPTDYVSFRVLVPIKIEGVIVIEKDALVNGRILEAKRGERWGKAGKLSWIMIDAVAVDLSRVPVQASQELPSGRNRIRGISHGGEVAARTVMLGALFPPAAAIAVIGGAFKRGGDAILPEGKRFVVYVQKETSVTVSAER
jgi:hypothetical protein